jgi:hypothetical protein
MISPCKLGTYEEEGHDGTCEHDHRGVCQNHVGHGVELDAHSKGADQNAEQQHPAPLGVDRQAHSLPTQPQLQSVDNEMQDRRQLATIT